MVELLVGYLLLVHSLLPYQDNQYLISGQTVVASVTTNISGQTIRFTNDGVNNVVSISGQTVVASVITNISGQVVATSGTTIYLVDNGINNVVKISGQTVIASVSLGTTPTSGDASRISGQSIYIVDDSINNKVKISGQLVAVSGIVAVNSLPVISVSGNVVRISGETISVSGIIRLDPAVPQVSGDAVRISGQTVYLVNDGVNNVVEVSGQLVAVSGVVTALVSGGINVSGNIIRISGQLVAVSGVVTVTNTVATTQVSGSVANVSGNTIYLIDDSINNKVKISGQTVSVSGSISINNASIAVTLPAVPTSGDASRISGQLVAVSGIVAVNSLPVISVSGSLVSVSGTITVNSLPVISISGNAVRTSGQTSYLVNDGVNNVVQISGQTVVGSFTASVSGQPVRTSGQVSYFVNDGVNNVVWISGQVVTASVVTNISGQTVIISGQPTIIADSFGTLPRAQVTTTASFIATSPNQGALNTASLGYGFDDFEGQWSKLRVTTSGDGSRLIVSISGQPITGSFSANANVSGNTVYTVNDGVNNVVSISGQTVVASVTTNISGQSVRLPNDGVNNVVWISGQFVNIDGGIVEIQQDGNTPRVTDTFLTNTWGRSDFVLGTAALTHGFDGIANSWQRLRVTNSGDGFKLIVTTSGQPVYLVDDGVNNVVKISGQTVVASVSLGTTPTSGDAARVSGQVFYTVDDSVNNKVKISGQLVAVSGIVNIGNSPVVLVSGQTVSVSGTVAANVSGATVSVSGIVSMDIPTQIRTRAELACTALSGGTQLLSGDVRKATVLNAGSAGTIMFIGSTTDPPFSGFGFRLVAGNGLTLETNNFDRIRAFAATSGIMISYIGEQY